MPNTQNDNFFFILTWFVCYFSNEVFSGVMLYTCNSYLLQVMRGHKEPSPKMLNFYFKFILIELLWKILSWNVLLMFVLHWLFQRYERIKSPIIMLILTLDSMWHESNESRLNWTWWIIRLPIQAQVKCVC